MSPAAGCYLPSPDFNHPFRCVAGLRPYRETTYRLEPETVGDQVVFHNYGHGGAGITMSWGCAYEVGDMVSGHFPSESQLPVAVLGAGVIGLTVAALLNELGFKVSVYSRDFTPNTTSDVAGGQWLPSAVEYEKTPQGLRELHRILRRSFRAHESRIGLGYGVSRRPNFTLAPSASFAKVPKDLIPEPAAYKQLPFEKLRSEGYSYETLLIEPPIFMKRLTGDLVQARVPLIHREFHHVEDVRQLPERVVVNCTGLGSRFIWPDPKLKPIKGQLALLPPQPGLEYLFSANLPGKESGYLFPREDAVVVGGTFEVGVEDPTPQPDICAELVARMKTTFQGQVQNLTATPHWILRDE